MREMTKISTPPSAAEPTSPAPAVDALKQAPAMLGLKTEDRVGSAVVGGSVPLTPPVNALRSDAA